MKKLVSLLVVLFMVFALSACGKYYMIKDPSSEKVYYTQKIKDQKGGAVKFQDGQTGSEITLQNSEVTKISKDEFKANTQVMEEKMMDADTPEAKTE